MIKKATLLIRNLERIYPMTPTVKTSLSNGFIAVHHDYILAIGQGQGDKYVDKDTRIVEGRSHIAIPGMIDCNFDLHDCSSNKLWEIGELLVRHGTMIVHSQPLREAMMDVLHPIQVVDGHYTEVNNDFPVYDLRQPDAIRLRRFCISCHYPCVDSLDQLLMAKICALQHPHLHPLQILASCTYYPAMALGHHDAGKLKRGGRANIILLEGGDFTSVLSRFHGDESMQIIKDGVRLWPYLLI